MDTFRNLQFALSKHCIGGNSVVMLLSQRDTTQYQDLSKFIKHSAKLMYGFLLRVIQLLFPNLFSLYGMRIHECNVTNQIHQVLDPMRLP